MLTQPHRDKREGNEMYFNDGRVMSPAETSIYHRLNRQERIAFLDEGTSAVKLTQSELHALSQEYEDEIALLREQELIAFLSD